MCCFVTIAMILWAARRDLRDENHEARNRSLEGAWRFVEWTVYICWAAAVISLFCCLGSIWGDSTFLSLFLCIFTCDCQENQCDPVDFECLDSCRDCKEPGGCCYSDPHAEPLCDCSADPDAKPFCYKDPDAPPLCCAEDALYCASDPDAPPLCCTEDSKFCRSDPDATGFCTEETCDCSRLDCTLPECTCRCDCLPEDACTDCIECCNTCFKIITCQFKVELEYG
ncbi:hypothetical protein AAMO2058_000885900 [Amorphochlora amoebiformis]